MSIRQGEAHSTFAAQLRVFVLVAAILGTTTVLLPGKAAAVNGTTVTASDGSNVAIPGETINVTSPNINNATFCDLVFVDSLGTPTGSEDCTPASPDLFEGSLVVPLTAAYDVATVYVCQPSPCSGKFDARTAKSAARATITIEQPVPVPNVLGLVGENAVAKLNSVGLSAQPSGSLAGTVTDQRPAAGVGVKSKSTVHITLVVLVPVPDLGGLTATGAQQRLSAVHLRLHGVLTAPGTVIDQSPAPNKLAPENSEVTVTLLAPASTPSQQGPATAVPSASTVTSPGPVTTQSSKITVPTFTGLRNDAAVGLAGGQGLKTRWHGGSRGTVKLQSIAPGTLVDAGTEIVLTSSDTASVSLTVLLLALIGLAAGGAVAGRPVRWIRRLRARRVRRWFSTHVDMTVRAGVYTELRPDNVAAGGWPPVEMSWSSLRSYSLRGGAK